MKLNKKSRDEQRKRVDIKLNDVEFNPNRRIKLPKEKLEELLFEVKRDKNGKTYKILAFIGNNMCKLDLSQIDFTNISYDSTFPVNLSGINVAIDFNKSYEVMNKKPLVVTNIDFENVDLSSNDLEKLTSDGRSSTAKFKCCDLSNTRLDLSGTVFVDFISCNLSNLDLEDLELNIAGCDEAKRLKLNDEFDEILFVGCNLSNTKASIKVSSYLAPEVQDALRIALKANKLDKCTFIEVKGNEIIKHPIKTKCQRAAQKSKVLKKYATFEAREINNTLDLIDAQLSSAGGRQLSVKKNTLRPTTPKDAIGLID